MGNIAFYIRLAPFRNVQSIHHHLNGNQLSFQKGRELNSYHAQLSHLWKHHLDDNKAVNNFKKNILIKNFMKAKNKKKVKDQNLYDFFSTVVAK